jgi:peptidoglycan/LPS O-acetylase OafA/YrhL
MSLRQLWRRAGGDLWRRPPGHFWALDGMRGFASVIIHVYHCAMFTALFAAQAPHQPELAWTRFVLNGFWTGIDIFYVLSGFLIGRILILELATDGFIHYRKFLTRRTFRIFPAYYLMITLSLLVLSRIRVGLFPFLFGTNDWGILQQRSWSNYVYVSNYLYPGSEANIMSWGWSLCVEEHFYLVLPPLLWIIFRYCRGSLRAGLLSACVVLPLVGRAVQYARDPSIVLLNGFYYYSHNRFDEIFIGVLIAYFYAVHTDAMRQWVHRFRHVLWVAGVACGAVVWAVGGLQKGGAFPVIWQFFLMALASGLLLMNGLFLRNRATRFFEHPFWYPLSRVSYGSYLIHPFVLFTVLSAYHAHTGTVRMGLGVFLAFCTLVIAISTVLAATMFMLLERPMLDLGIRLSRKWDTATRGTALFSLGSALRSERSSATESSA